jgi:TRAP transporter TAXI family solute receptor
MTGPALRRRALLAGGLGLLAAGRARAQTEARFFRIGTGGPTGTYFPIGSLIADAISRPPGSPPCALGGSCGVEGLVAAALTTMGSVDNVQRVALGELESGLVQADVAWWAYSGTGIFAEDAGAPELRALASLYPETLHLVVRGDLEVASVADLRGKRIALDELGSGTLVDARLTLEAHGLSEDDILPIYQKPHIAVGMMRRDEADGFFIMGGWPLRPVEEALDELLARLVPITGEPRLAILETAPFFAEAVIPASAYRTDAETPTIAVHALWVTTAAIRDQLAHDLVKALWHPRSVAHIAGGHPRGADITLASALEGLGIPLHPGAERFYREQGLLVERE